MKKNKFLLLTFAIFLSIIIPNIAFAAPYSDCGEKTDNGSYTGICMDKSDNSNNCQSGIITNGIGCDSNEKCCKTLAASKNPVDPSPSYVDTSTSSEGIVPCGRTFGKPCTICHLIVGIQRLVDWGKSIVVTVAIVGLVIAGLIYMLSSGSESMMTLAKNCFKASLIGFSIAIAAWIVVNTVLTMLFTPSSNDIGLVARNWNSFTCDTTSSATIGGSRSSSTSATTAAQNAADCDKYCNNGGDVDLGTDIPTCKSTCIDAKAKEQSSNQNASAGTGLSQSAVKEKLDSSSCGVTYDKNNLSTLNGVQDVSVNEICKFKNNSGCDTKITSGTGGTHKMGSFCTHSNGCKFDFTPTSCNDTWIKNNYPNTGTRSDGAACYSAPDGACYAREGNPPHWDMSTTRSCKDQGC